MPLALVILGVFSTTHLIVWLIIGLIAGFLATRVIRGPHYGIIGDIVIGLVGAFLAGLLLNFLLPDKLIWVHWGDCGCLRRRCHPPIHHTFGCQANGPDNEANPAFKVVATCFSCKWREELPARYSSREISSATKAVVF